MSKRKTGAAHGPDRSKRHGSEASSVSAAPVIIEVDIDLVFENPANPRTIKDAAFKKLVKSIADFPQMLWKRPPVCVSEGGKYMALGGNKRSEAARKAGLKRIPIMLADDWTEDQKKRFVVLDNDASGEWDFNMLVGQYDMAFLLESTSIALPQSMFKGKGMTDPDAAPPVPKVPVSRLGDVWNMGPHRILCGDSTKDDDMTKLMDGDKAELVWTDPPYGVAIGDKNKWLNSVGRSNRIERNLEHDTDNDADLLAMLRSAFGAGAKHCAPGASWYAAAPPGPLHLLWGQALNELGIFRQTIQWVKNNATFSPMGVCYHWRCEPIFFGWLPNAGKRWHGGRKQDTVWEIDRPMKSPDHPTMKPVELVKRAILNSCEAGLIVLDMFSGSGTTVIACEETGRVARVMDIAPEYVDVAVRRWQEFTGRTATLAATGQTFAQVQADRA